MKYKILVALTFFLPISSYLLYSAINAQTYDYQVYTQENAVIEFYAYDEGFIVLSEDAEYSGYLVPYNGSYALYFEDTDIIKIERDYFMVHDGEFKNLEDIPVPVEQSNNVIISISSIVALGIVMLIIGAKMDILKSHPRASVMVSLIVGTFILWGISSIVSDMLSIFVIATITWASYLIENMVHKGKLNDQEGNKIESDLLKRLKALSNE